MRILQVTPGYYPAIGGVERHVRSLSEALVRLGHEVVVATLAPDRSNKHGETLAGVEIRRFPAIGPRAYRIPIGLVRYLLQERRGFDVVHAHNYHAIPLLEAVVATGTQAVISPYFHGQGHSRLARVLHSIYAPFAISALRRIGGAVCLSSGEADLVARRLGIPRERITILPSGITPNDDTDTRVLSRAPELLLFVGRLESYKRVDRAINALAHLPNSYRLLIVGNGPDRSRLEELSVQRGVQQRVSFLGRIGDRELNDLYHQAQIVLSFSEAESFGITILEALAAGCRVVCNDIPAFRDFALAHPDTVALAPAALDERNLAAFIQTVAARPDVAVDLDRYRWSQISAEMVSLYETVAGRQPLVSAIFPTERQTQLKEMH